MRSGVKCCPTCAVSQQELSCPAVLYGDHCSIPSLSPGYTQSTVQRILSLSVSAHRTTGVLWKQRCSLARAGRTGPWWARQRQDATPVLSRKMDVYSTHAHKRQYPRYHWAAAQRVPKDGQPHHHHHDHRGDSAQPGSAAHTCVCTGGSTHWVEGGGGGMLKGRSEGGGGGASHRVNLPCIQPGSGRWFFTCTALPHGHNTADSVQASQSCSPRKWWALQFWPLGLRLPVLGAVPAIIIRVLFER